MADLLKYTKKIAQQIKYYDAVADFAKDSCRYNPFYENREVLIIWNDKLNEPKSLRH